jgi:Uma2 family endonuclease
MAAIQALDFPQTTFDAVVECLGGISLKRIAASPPPGAATESDLLSPRSDQADRLYELVDGVLVEKAMGSFESLLAGVLIQLLRNFLDVHPLGTVLAPDGMLRLMPGLVRVPDVSFISWDRFPDRRRPREAIFTAAPDLAVEIISEGNTAAEMDRKLREYFSAGARLVWLVYPEEPVVRVYTNDNEFTLVGEDGTLDGGELLPGFRLPVREWLQRAWPPFAT